MKKTDIDTLIHSAWLIPVEPDNRILTGYALAIKDGLILDILPAPKAEQAYSAQNTVNCLQHVLIPGFINAHTHAAMSLLRGIADDLPLMEWLQQHIWPAESKWVNEEFVQTGTELAIAEMLRSGTTCFADMYFFPDITATVVRKAGIRACLGLIVLDFPTIWAANPDEYISKAIALHDKLHDDPLITTMFAPHAPYTVSDAPFKRIKTIADELDIPIQSHIHETFDEVEQALKQNQQRPLQRLDELGLLSPSLMAVHMTQLNDAEIEKLAHTGTHVIHCPESNMKLASGACPTDKLLRAGINVALGTDGAASNNDLDMLGEMRSAALLAKLTSADARSLPAASALRMATLNGAKALGLGDRTGSLEIGKAADIVAVNLQHISTQPLYDPISQLVYAAGREQITDVWIAGQPVLKNRQLTTINEAKLLAKVARWQQKISATIPAL